MAPIMHQRALLMGWFYGEMLWEKRLQGGGLSVQKQQHKKKLKQEGDEPLGTFLS